MSDRITGQLARNLLDNLNDPYTPIGYVPVRGLLETLAWLYGGDPEGCTDEYYVDYIPGLVLLNAPDALGPGEAVEFARSILAAAEEARNE